jgi:hypothetical protein
MHSKMGFIAAAAALTLALEGQAALLSSGYGFFGMGPMPLTDAGGNALTAWEADGVIQFQGTFSSIGFTATNSPDWSGLTIGAADAVGPVPEPDSLILAVMGLALLAFTGWRRSRVGR